MYAAGDGNGVNGTNKTEAFHSPACTATNTTQMLDLINSCPAGTFPLCTIYKQTCASAPEYTPCLTTLGGGYGAEAARQCPGTRVASLAMDNIVSACFDSDAVSCSFWRQRCADDVNCHDCLAAMGNGDSASAIAADWSSPACQRAVQDGMAVHYLSNVAECPGISTCRTVVTACSLSYGDFCIACFNGSAPPSLAAYCRTPSEEFSVSTACQACPDSAHTINLVVFDTAAVGGASAATCVAVATTIVAHGRDRVSTRDRIVVGLMLANAVYSTANAIPVDALRTGVVDCGRLAMSFDTIRFGRAWWFCGKYGLVGFELFILGASIRALLRGMTAVPPCAEAAIHAACCALALLAFTVFYVLCASINTEGYTTATEYEVYTNAWNHASTNDDLDE
jgi:hypothetical protein